MVLYCVRSHKTKIALGLCYNEFYVDGVVYAFVFREETTLK